MVFIIVISSAKSLNYQSYLRLRYITHSNFIRSTIHSGNSAPYLLGVVVIDVVVGSAVVVASTVVVVSVVVG